MTLYSKTKIRKLGDRIRSCVDSHVDSKDIEMLEKYRVSYKKYISLIFNKLYIDARSVRHDSITTYRIKRIESIIRKLHRYPKMELDRMSDVAGCRCILKNESKVYKLRELIFKNFNVVKENDYYKNPVVTGYKSIHLYVKHTEGDKWPVEIQLRTKNDHNWATLVEIIDQLYDKSLKEGEYDPKFARFFHLMVSLKSLSMDERIDLISLTHDLEIFQKLYSVFVQNYLSVRINWLNVKKSKAHHFFVIEVKGDKPEIFSFNDFGAAESEYFNRFNADSGSNIVLTYLPITNFESLETAYSNYTLTTHTFIDDYFRLLSDVIPNLLKKGKYKQFYKIFRDTQINLYSSFMHTETEYLAMEDVYKNDDSKVKFWAKDFSKRINRRELQLNRIAKEIDKTRPKSGMKMLVFSFYTWRINRRDDKLQKAFESRLKQINRTFIE